MHFEDVAEESEEAAVSVRACAQLTDSLITPSGYIYDTTSNDEKICVFCHVDHR